MKFYKSLFATMLFLVITISVYYIHITYFKVNVVLYSALADGMLSTIFCTIILVSMRYFAIFSTFEKFQLGFIWFLIAYILAISVPTVIDRSLSFYILEKLQQRGGGIKLDAFESIFIKEYTKEHHLIDVRITEQSQSGTIIIENGCVKLTEKGNTLATFSRFFRSNLLPKHRLLMGQYTDALTDPFRMSEEITSYECR